MNIAQILERSRRLFPDKTALIFEDKRLTYRELDEMSNRVANRLSAQGIARGDRVALFLPNIPAFVSAYFGIQKIGAIAVCVNAAYKADETQFILADSGARALVTTEALRGNVPGENLPQLKHILVAEDRQAFVVSDEAQFAESRSNGTAGSTPQTPLRAGLRTNADLSLGELFENASPLAQAIDCAPNDPAVILYSMATDGFPQGATLSQENVVWSARVAAATFRLNPNDCVLLFLPAFYNFGQNGVCLPCFDVGATLVLHRDYGSAKILQSIVEHHVTVFFGVPTIYTILFGKASAEQMRSVRFYNSAAALLPRDRALKWRGKFGLDITDHYGMTEISMASFNHLRQYKPGSIGTPIEGVEIQVVDERGRPVETGHVGEIVVRGRNVMLGYWNRPAETSAVLKDGWFHTGDLGWVDADGYFYFAGILKDMVNVGGQKVYAAQVERVLRQHPAVADAAIYGVPDAVMGEQVRASVVLKAGGQISAEELIAYCEQHVADFKVPRGIEFDDALPKAHTGKVLKQVLRERFQARLPMSKLSEQAAPLSRESVQDWIIQWLACKLSLEPGAIETNRPFVDYGFTSLMAVTFALDLSRWSGRSISPLITWNYPTIDALARHLAKGSNGANAPNEPIEPNLSNLSALSDDELAQMLADEIDLARSKTQ